MCTQQVNVPLSRLVSTARQLSKYETQAVLHFSTVSNFVKGKPPGENVFTDSIHLGIVQAISVMILRVVLYVMSHVMRCVIYYM